MIKLNLNGEELALTFRHNRYDKPQQVGLTPRPVVGVTYAWIYGLDNEKKMNRGDARAAGIALCAIGDNFCKETGRRVALSKAVSRWPRDIRKLVFAQYDGRRKG